MTPLSTSERQFIADNPHVHGSILARMLGRNSRTVERYRRRLGCVPKWSHRGCGVPFTRFHLRSGCYRVEWRHKVMFESSNFERISNFVWWFGECIERGYMDAPRVAHPYFTGLSL